MKFRAAQDDTVYSFVKFTLPNCLHQGKIIKAPGNERGKRWIIITMETHEQTKIFSLNNCFLMLKNLTITNAFEMITTSRHFHLHDGSLKWVKQLTSERLEIEISLILFLIESGFATWTFTRRFIALRKFSETSRHLFKPHHKKKMKEIF